MYYNKDNNINIIYKYIIMYNMLIFAIKIQIWFALWWNKLFIITKLKHSISLFFLI